MAIDPLSQYGIVNSGQTVPVKKKSDILTVLLVILLLIFLLLSLYLVSTQTSFFNFASSLTGGESPVPSASPSVITTVNTDTATTSATNVETTSTSTAIPVFVPTPIPASTPASVIIENSYLFASPLTASTGNVQKIRITIFVLDGTGAGISGKTVSLTGVEKLAVYSVQPVTDATGKATFDVAAGISGSYLIGATVGGASLSQTVSVTFN
jgi:hypothetical protein